MSDKNINVKETSTTVFILSTAYLPPSEPTSLTDSSNYDTAAATALIALEHRLKGDKVIIAHCVGKTSESSPNIASLCSTYFSFVYRNLLASHPLTRNMGEEAMSSPDLEVTITGVNDIYGEESLYGPQETLAEQELGSQIAKTEEILSQVYVVGLEEHIPRIRRVVEGSKFYSDRKILFAGARTTIAAALEIWEHEVVNTNQIVSFPESLALSTRSEVFKLAYSQYQKYGEIYFSIAKFFVTEKIKSAIGAFDWLTRKPFGTTLKRISEGLGSKKHLLDASK